VISVPPPNARKTVTRRPSSSRLPLKPLSPRTLPRLRQSSAGSEVCWLTSKWERPLPVPLRPRRERRRLPPARAQRAQAHLLPRARVRWHPWGGPSSVRRLACWP
jgi:hypothetical protein